MEASLLRPWPDISPLHSTLPAKVKHTSTHNSYLNLRKNVRNRFQSEKQLSDSETDIERTETARHQRHLSLKPELLCGAFACVGITRDVLQPWVVDSGDSDASEDDFSVSRSLEVTPLQLCLLMLTVVKSLCQAGQQREEHKRLISAFIVPHLTQLLGNMTRESRPLCSPDAISRSNSGACDGCSSGDGWSDTTGDSYLGTNDESSSSEEQGESFYGTGWTSADLVFVERYIVRIMVMLVSYLCMQSNGIAVVKASGCLTSWLDVACRCMRSVTSEAGHLQPHETTACCVRLASDIVNGVLLLLHAVFSSIPLNPSILHMAREIFANFLDHHGLVLSENIIVWYENHHVVSDRTSVETAPADLILAVGKVISSLKLAKVDYIHTVKCTKRKHRKCNFDYFFHHHNDILNIERGVRERKGFMGSEGVEMSDDANSDLGVKAAQSECAIAILARFLQRLLERCRSCCVKLCILSCVEDAGLCCCLPPHFVQSIFLDNLEDQPAMMRHRMLHVFTVVVLHQLGGSAAVQRCSNPCATCKDISEHGTPAHGFIKQETSDSAFSGSDVSQHEDEALGTDINEPRWHCLKRLQSLILHCNQCLGAQTMQHLLHLVRWGSPVLLYQLFQHIFLPVMHASRENGQTQVSEKVTHYCLIALPLLLRTPQAYNLFLNYSGVKQLWQLAQIVELRPCVLHVFQVLIMLDDRITEQDSDISGALTNESMHSRESVVLDMFLHMLLSDSHEFVSKTINADNISAEEDLRHSDWLVAKSEQWSSCDSLFVQSRKFRHCFVKRNGAQIAYDMLTWSLSLLSEACDDDVVRCHYEGGDRWFWQCLSLVQSSLNICLACCQERALFGNSVSTQYINFVCSHVLYINLRTLWQVVYIRTRLCDLYYFTTKEE